jgi:hypothetical protein
MKRIVLIYVVAIGSLAIGVFAGRIWAWHTYSQLVVSKQIEAAEIAEYQAQPLAMLRLGETNEAIRTLESFMDEQVLMLEYRRDHDFVPLDAQSKKRVDMWLTPVKIYHENYPVAGEDAASISNFLATVPGRTSPRGCQNAICRLDDLRLNKLDANTNSP